MPPCMATFFGQIKFVLALFVEGHLVIIPTEFFSIRTCQLISVKMFYMRVLISEL